MCKTKQQIMNGGTKEDLAVQIINLTRAVERLEGDMRALVAQHNAETNELVSSSYNKLSWIKNLLGAHADDPYIRKELDEFFKFLDESKKA